MRDGGLFIGLGDRNFLILFGLCRDLDDVLVGLYQCLLLLDQSLFHRQSLLRLLLQRLLLILQFLLLRDFSLTNWICDLLRRTNLGHKSLNDFNPQRLTRFLHGFLERLLKGCASRPLNKITSGRIRSLQTTETASIGHDDRFHDLRVDFRAIITAVKQHIDFRRLLRDDSEFNHAIETDPKTVFGRKPHVAFLAKVETLTATVNLINASHIRIQIMSSGFQSRLLNASLTRLHQ